MGQLLTGDVDGDPGNPMELLLCAWCLLCTQDLVTTLYFGITFSAAVVTIMTKCLGLISGSHWLRTLMLGKFTFSVYLVDSFVNQE